MSASNRSNPNEKSNQVSIAGQIEGVEVARARVRELTPLIFVFDMPIITQLQNGAPDNNDPYLKAIQDQYNVQVTFKSKVKNFHTTVVVIKGSESEASRVKEATLMVMEHLCGSAGNATLTPNMDPMDSHSVTVNMEISPQHHAVVLGKGNMTLKWIMQKTNTTILFPDASDPNVPAIRRGSVTITGSIHNVYTARQQLIGSLPVVMMFDIPDEAIIYDETVQRLQQELDLQIVVKPRARHCNRAVVIKAQERFSGNMYKARHVLLKLEGAPISAAIPESYNIHMTQNAANLGKPTALILDSAYYSHLDQAHSRL